MVTDEKALSALRAVLSRAVADGPVGARLYMLFDTAHDPLIYDWLTELGDEIEAQSLYQGDIGARLAHVSPYLLRLRDAEDGAWSLAVAGYRRSWSVFLIAAVEFDAVRRHLRKFNLVYRNDGTPLVFRFYDPRVLRRFLPTCTVEELQTFFGPVDAFLAETEDDALIRFTLRGGEMMQSRLPLPV